MVFKAIIFDLDGTLLDTLQDLADAANSALAEMGLPPHPTEAYRWFVGDGAGKLMERVLPEDRRDPTTCALAMQTFARRYSENWWKTTRPYPGVMPLLDELAARRMPLAVLSNKPDDFTQLCVEKLLGHHRFALVAGAKLNLPRKPDPAGALAMAGELKVAPDDCFYLGDTATDMQTALAAGMFPAGALWGFRTRDELHKAGAKALLQTPPEVLQWIKRGGGL